MLDINVFTDEQLLTLELEYNLTTGYYLSAEGCTCSSYLIGRKSVLIPEVLKQAYKEKTDPAEIFARFARRLHQIHE